MVKTMNDIGNRQPDSNAGCSNQKGVKKVKNKQTRQLMLWIGALIVGAVLGMFGINAPIGIMGIILPIYTIIDMVETAENVWSDSCVCAMVDKDLKG